MAVPTYIGAGTGQAILTGTATVSKTGCTADNLILIHLLIRGATVDYSDSAATNLKKQDGTAGFSQVVANASVGGSVTSKHEFFIGRVSANGTCSVDYTVGASGNDLFVRIYEFGGVYNSGTNIGTGTLENDAAREDHGAATGTAITDIAVVTNGAERLACQFIALETNQTPGAMTGMTGGTWAVADTFASSSGALGTLQLQTASIASAGTIDGGSVTVTSTGWGLIALALIPASVGQTLLPDADTAGGNWINELGAATPLYSKLADSSDSTYIAGTAS